MQERRNFIARTLELRLSCTNQSKCGVLQVVILGPLLCLVYINDMPSVSKLFMPILFADDTNQFCAGKDFKDHSPK